MTNDTSPPDALQKLAALVSDASDRDRGTYLILGGAQRVESERRAARDKLAALSHLLLPAFEALDTPPCPAGGFCGTRPGGGCPSCLQRTAALARLEEALK